MGILVIVGMTMDPYGAVILVSASFATIAYRNGIHPAHFWMVVLVAFELGYLTPTADGNRQLIVLGPKKRVETFAVDAEGELARVSGRRAEEDRAVALFQKANEIFTSGKLHPPKP